MNLKNKIIVITGGSSGLGEALARASAQQGARVIITSKNSSRLKKLAKELGLLTVVADVTKENQVKRVVNAALKAYGRIDIWINNAGISMDQGPLESLDLAQARAVMEVNYFGTLIGCRQALRALSRGGTIVNILSLGCFNPHPNAMSVNYYASKFAADALTRSLQPTLKERKIKVIGVYPGGIKTFLRGLRRRVNYREFMDPDYVARRIVSNLQRSTPRQQQKIWKPSS